MVRRDGDDAALDALLRVTVLLGQDMNRSLARLGLTESRAHVVWLLGSIGPCSQRRLADALAVSPRTVTGLVNGLVETGFVTREPHPDDGRATLVTPTARGRRVFTVFDRDRRRLAAQLFGALPAGTVASWTTTTAAISETLDHLTGTGKNDLSG